ncbi:MAG: ACP S-malonyltransferase [Gemmataceae bacterium]
MARSCFLFPGQGAQYVGMAKALCETLPAARALFDVAHDVLGFDLLSLCANGPADRLNATDISQPALYVAGLAALESLRASNPQAIDSCVATAGLSLGEYTALTFAGSLSFQDGLRVVQARGRAMQAAAEATAGAMISMVGPDVAAVEQLCADARERSHGIVQIANLLCPGNTVISGAADAVGVAESLANERGFRGIRLAVAGAFHTDLMKPADETLAKALNGVTLKSPRFQVWSNVDAKPHTDPGEIKDLLVRQVISPVRMEESLRGLLSVGCDQFYELGPGKVLAGLLKRVDRKMPCNNVAA